jgi:mono/diheme cytochrome c family protein
MPNSKSTSTNTRKPVRTICRPMFSGIAPRQIATSGLVMIAMMLITLAPTTAASGADQRADVKQFLKQHCVKCHGPANQKADRRVDDLPFEFDNDDDLGQWQDILDQLNLGDMPPASEPRPDAEQLKSVIATLSNEIRQAHATARDNHSETILRRLNRREYLNTIRDLFGFDMTMFDPTIGFPEDATEEGLDNQGETLVTSSYLLENYLSAAEKIIDKAIVDGPRPKPQRIKMRPPFDRTTNAHSGWVTQERRKTREFQSIFQGTKERFGYRPLDDIVEGVPADGFYKIRIRACGRYREHDYPLDLIGTDPEEPIRLALVSGSQEFGTLHLRQSIEKTLAVFDLPDDEPQWQERTIWLDKGFQPRMTYQNGPYFFKVLPNIIHRKFPEKFPIKLVFSNWWEVCQNIKTPQIRVHEVELEGPFYDQWPPASHEAIFGERSFEANQIPEILKRFATRAFRRPVRKEELETILELVDSRQALGEPPLEALKAGLIATLCSPGFLYFEDSAKTDTNLLDSYSIASRLSYFLWSTMPDQTLLDLAAKGQLTDPDVVVAQTRRMLKDEKAHAFASDFSDRWLTLYKLGEMPPDNRKFEHYFVGELESAMRTETHLFFKHVLDQNLDIGNFLESDFTFINRPLARHYDFDLELFEQQFQTQSPSRGFVKFPLDNQARGGLFGQASVLTVTANGIDTSPVIRGVWVLDNILGASTPPPPEGVEPLEPDTRGSVSIRDQLQKHRNVATCAECHKKIDPLGFALESFDAIGGERSHYVSRRKRLKIDTSGKLPDGQEFSGIAQLKTILSDRKPQFARCLTEKMLSYAIGRRLTIRDRPVVDDVVNSLDENQAGLKDLVLKIVQSETFLSR